MDWLRDLFRLLGFCDPGFAVGFWSNLWADVVFAIVILSIIWIIRRFFRASVDIVAAIAYAVPGPDRTAARIEFYLRNKGWITFAPQEIRWEVAIDPRHVKVVAESVDPSTPAIGEDGRYLLHYSGSTTDYLFSRSQSVLFNIDVLIRSKGTPLMVYQVTTIHGNFPRNFLEGWSGRKLFRNRNPEWGSSTWAAVALVKLPHQVTDYSISAARDYLKARPTEKDTVLAQEDESSQYLHQGYDTGKTDA